MKTCIWGGMFAGSGAGSFLPLLWGASPLSFASVITTFIGGIVGIWVGYQVGKYLGV